METQTVKVPKTVMVPQTTYETQTIQVPRITYETKTGTTQVTRMTEEIQCKTCYALENHIRDLQAHLEVCGRE